MFAEFTTIEKAKGLLGFIIILGLGYYAYPYDLLSLLFGAITIALIVRLLWVSKMNYEMKMETHNAIASIILEGSALRTQAMYKHVIFNPDLYDESYEKVSFDNDELYDFGYENEDYLIVDSKVENNDHEIIQYGIYSKVHDIWIAAGCRTDGLLGPSDKDSYWLSDENLNIIRDVSAERYRNVNIKKFIDIESIDYGRVDKKYLTNFKKSAKRENYY